MAKLAIKWMSCFVLFCALSAISFCNYAGELSWSFNKIPEHSSRHIKQVLTSILNDNQVLPQGEVGIVALNLKTGEKISINGDIPFFMASTYKIAIATQLLTLVDKKLLSLDKMITIKPSDIVPGSGILSKYFQNDVMTISVQALLKLMLQESDNTATDLLLHLAGGPEAVTGRLQELKITGMTVNRSTLEFTRDYFNVQLPPPEKRSIDVLMSLYQKSTPNIEKFLEDNRDNATANAMVKLLSMIKQGEALSPESTNFLLSVMSKRSEETGRLYYYLPGVKVFQKLGTGDLVVNDVGIIDLPDNMGSIAIVIFLRHVPTEQIVKGRVTALIAKSIYDYFIFHSIYSK